MNPATSKLSIPPQDAGYEVVADWPRLPPHISWPEVSGVAIDSRERVYLFNRGEHPVAIFDAEGNFLKSWGEGIFARPHGISIGPDDAVYCTDDLDHTVRKFAPDGKLLLTLGTSGAPSNTGATSVDYRTIRQAAGPFHFPTNLALSPVGEMYVSDGYGNARIHKFAPDGRLLLSWGEPGAGPGQFHVPHGIAVDSRGVVYVADRENSRIQLFSPEGKFLSEWTDDIARPSQIFIDPAENILVAELGYRAGMWPGTIAPSEDATGGRVSIYDVHGSLKARWGGGYNPCVAGDFFAPHDICVDKAGAVYISEVTWSAGGRRGLVPADCHAIQKFARR
jgi:DNA-binding beta-propeller fold protein YncE